MSTTSQKSVLPVNGTSHQEPFSRVAPLLEFALLLGAGGGFVLASVLTLTVAFSLPLGSWWAAIAQAHGHLQLYGWAGLFVLGVAFHFLPRLRGTPLVAPRLVPWILGVQASGLLLRAISQPLLTVTGANTWRIVLIISGILECGALVAAVTLLALTARRGPALASRPAFRGILPFVLGAFSALGIASIVNLVNVVWASAGGGLVPGVGDDLDVMLGLLGFLVPMALAMSARSLPMYAGLEAFPQRVLWPMAITYLLGLLLICLGTNNTTSLYTLSALRGVGMVLVGGIILAFVGVFFRLMSTRGRLPKRVSQLAPAPGIIARSYQVRVVQERGAFGPFVALVASAYLWAILGSVLLCCDGVALCLRAAPVFPLDAMRHSFAIGFIALLICGIAPRMLPGFSGGKIVSARLVTATLWLGNIAAFLRVGSLLLSPLLGTVEIAGVALTSITFGLSGPLGLALAICLAVNLWPTLRYKA